MSTFVTTSGAIRAAVGFAQHAVCKEPNMHALRSVYCDFRSMAHVGPDGSLRVVPGVTFVCTDRYRLAWATVPESMFAPQDEDDAPHWDSADLDPMMLDSGALFDAIKAFPKPSRVGGGPFVSVTVVPGKEVRFDHANGAVQVVKAADVAGLTFPKVASLIENTGKGKPAKGSPILAFNPGYLSDACKAATLIASRSQAVRLFPQAPGPLLLAATPWNGPELLSVAGSEILMPVGVPAVEAAA